MQQHRFWKLGLSALLGSVIALSVASCGAGSSGSASQVPVSAIYSPNSTPPSAVAAAQTAHTSVDSAIVTADNAFGLALLKHLADDTNNVAISPISLALALQILYNGAMGSTQQAMGSALQLGDLSTQQMNDDNAALQAALLDADLKVQLTIANSLWIDVSNSPVLPSFVQTDNMYYGATLGDLAGAPANVNAWVAEQTNGLITDILPPDSSPADYRTAVIANALYFKGEWTTAFDPAQTANAPFTGNDGAQTPVPMMHQTGPFDYVHSAGAQVLRVPYGQGRLSMLIVLPDPGVDFQTFVSGITNERLAAWESGLQTNTVALALPRFKATFSTADGKPLVPILSALGMGVIFGSTANFSGLAPGTYVSDIEHKTVVEVDETGTVAAAATGVVVTTAVGPTASMAIDHPFFYAIQDDDTGELLFVGDLMVPSSN